MDYKKIIDQKGLKMKYVADQIGISRVLFSYYMNGTRPMPERIEKKLKSLLIS